MKKILLVDDEHTTLVATLEILKEKYELVYPESHFGQNATTLLVLKRKAAAEADGSGEAKGAK